MIALLIYLGSHTGSAVILLLGLALPFLLLCLWVGRSLWRQSMRGAIIQLWAIAFFAGAGQILLLYLLPHLAISYGPVPVLSLFYLYLLFISVTPFLLLWSITPVRRRLLVSRLTLILYLGVQLMALAISIDGYVREPLSVETTQVDITLDDLPHGSPPLRILLLSDIHMERFSRIDEKALLTVENAHPDAIFLAGDYLNLDYKDDQQAHDDLDRFLQRLAWTNPPQGIYAVEGTSDLLDNTRIYQQLATKRIKVPLLNQAAEWSLKSGRTNLTLYGLNYEGPGNDAARIHREGRKDGPRLLLYHTPELADTAALEGYDLYFCGHTHGGQITLPFYGAFYTNSQTGPRFVAGLYHLNNALNNGTQLYVTRGIGFEGLSAPRMRLGAAPEVTIITIHGP